MQSLALRAGTGTRCVRTDDVDDDANLLRAVANGDRRAFDRLSRRHVELFNEPGIWGKPPTVTAAETRFADAHA